jgi:hypothetical protein
MFQQAWQFKNVIVLCYNMHNVIIINGRVPPLLTWDILQIIVNSFLPIVSAYVLNQFYGHWLFSNVL